MDSTPTYEEMGQEGYITHSILTPDGEKECISAAFREYVPERFRIVLREETLELDCICSYPNYDSFSVDPRFHHIAYINFPPKYAPIEIREFRAAPFLDPDREALISRNEYLALMSTLTGEPDPSVSTLADKETNEAIKSLLEAPSDLDRFHSWAKKYTVSEITAMFSHFPGEYKIPKLSDQYKCICKRDREKMYGLWTRAFSKMMADSRKEMPFGNPAYLPYTPYERIASVVYFPDGSKVYCGEIEKRKHNSAEQHMIDSYDAGNETREIQRKLLQQKSDGESLLTYEDVSDRLHLSIRQVQKYKKDGVLSCMQLGPNSVRFEWKQVLKDLKKYGCSTPED